MQYQKFQFIIMEVLLLKLITIKSVFIQSGCNIKFLGLNPALDAIF